MNTVLKTKFFYSLLLFLALSLSAVFILPRISYAGTVYSQTLSSQNSDYGIPASLYQKLGTGLEGTVSSASYYIQWNGVGSIASTSLWIEECTTSVYTGCSWGATADYQDANFTTARKLTQSFLTPLTFNSNKYYRLYLSIGNASGMLSQGSYIRWYGTSSTTNWEQATCTLIGGMGGGSCIDDLKNLYFTLNNGLSTANDYIEFISPKNGDVSGYFNNFEIKYNYSNYYYNLFNDREIKVYVSNDNGITYPYVSTKTFFSTASELSIFVPVPQNLGFDDFTVYSELWIHGSKIFTSDTINFSTVSVLAGEGNNPFEPFAPATNSYILGKLTVESASNSKQTCGAIYEDSDSFLGRGIAYGACLAGSFLFEPSQYSVNLVKGQLYRIAVSFPFDYITTGFQIGTELLTDDFIASSSATSISLGFSIDFRGLDTSRESSQSFGIGTFNLMNAGMFNNVGSSGSSLMPIISTLRAIMVAILWITFLSGVVMVVSRYFNKTT